MEKLKPCPFCGGEAHHHVSRENVNGETLGYIWCVVCKSRTLSMKASEKRKVTRNDMISTLDFMWNYRKCWNKYPDQKPEREQEIQFYWVVDGEILRGYGVLEWHAWDCGDFVLRTTHTGESQSFLVEDTDVIYWYERPVPPKNQKEEHSNDK